MSSESIANIEKGMSHIINSLNDKLDQAMGEVECRNKRNLIEKREKIKGGKYPPLMIAERKGFEPLVPAWVQRFSRPPRSTTPASLQMTVQKYL